MPFILLIWLCTWSPGVWRLILQFISSCSRNAIRSRSSKWQDPTDFFAICLFFPLYSLINVKMGQPELNFKKIVAKTWHFCWLSSMNNVRHSQKTEFFSIISKIHISKMRTDSQKNEYNKQFWICSILRSYLI